MINAAPSVGDSPRNRAPAGDHPLLLFICHFTEGPSCCHSSGVEGGDGRREGGNGAVPQPSPEMSPPEPGMIRLWQVPEGQTVASTNCVSVSE